MSTLPSPPFPLLSYIAFPSPSVTLCHILTSYPSLVFSGTVTGIETETAEIRETEKGAHPRPICPLVNVYAHIHAHIFLSLSISLCLVSSTLCPISPSSYLISLSSSLYPIRTSREWGDRDRGGYSRNSNSNSSAGANPVRDALVVSTTSLYLASSSVFLTIHLPTPPLISPYLLSTHLTSPPPLISPHLTLFRLPSRLTSSHLSLTRMSSVLRMARVVSGACAICSDT